MVLTFGEILLRLSPKLGGEWIKEASIPTFIGGAELNVATALAQWGIPVAYATAMPENALSEEIKIELQRKKIETSRILFQGNRIGIYMLPQGADLKSAGVIYDRAYSSFSELKKEDIDWNTLFEGVQYFHLSAISPSLNQNVAEVSLAAVQEASKRDIQISFDLNYRAKLWKYGKDPLEIVPEIVKYAHIVMGNLWAANTLLSTPLDADVAVNNATKDQYLKHGEETSKAIQNRFENVRTVALTYRFDVAPFGINYYASLLNQNDFVVSKEFNTSEVVDKVGSGDCFMAGLLYGLCQNYTSSQIINYAASAAFGKLHEYGDVTQQTTSQILNRIEQ